MSKYPVGSILHYCERAFGINLTLVVVPRSVYGEHPHTKPHENWYACLDSKYNEIGWMVGEESHDKHITVIGKAKLIQILFGEDDD